MLRGDVNTHPSRGKLHLASALIRLPVDRTIRAVGDGTNCAEAISRIRYSPIPAAVVGAKNLPIHHVLFQLRTEERHHLRIGVPHRQHLRREDLRLRVSPGKPHHVFRREGVLPHCGEVSFSKLLQLRKLARERADGGFARISGNGRALGKLRHSCRATSRRYLLRTEHILPAPLPRREVVLQLIPEFGFIPILQRGLRVEVLPLHPVKLPGAHESRDKPAKPTARAKLTSHGCLAHRLGKLLLTLQRGKLRLVVKRSGHDQAPILE